MRVVATEAAEETVRLVQREGREDLVLVLGTGCCDSTAPFLYDRYAPGPHAVRVGEAAGVPVFAPRWLADLYRDDDGLQLDVDLGVVSDSFSLESEHGRRLTLRLLSPAPRPASR